MNTPTYITHIAGIPHRKPDLSILTIGQSVALVPEPENMYDPNAIKVMNGDVHLGYIPRMETQYAAVLKEMFITEIEPTRKWTEVKISNIKPEEVPSAQA